MYLDNISRLGKIAFENKDYSTAKECFSFTLENTSFIDERVNSELFLLKVAIAKEDKNILQLFDVVLKLMESTLILLSYKWNMPTSLRLKGNQKI